MRAVARAPGWRRSDAVDAPASFRSPPRALQRRVSGVGAVRARSARTGADDVPARGRPVARGPLWRPCDPASEPHHPQPRARRGVELAGEGAAIRRLRGDRRRTRRGPDRVVAARRAQWALDGSRGDGVAGEGGRLLVTGVGDRAGHSAAAAADVRRPSGGRRRASYTDRSRRARHSAGAPVDRHRRPPAALEGTAPVPARSPAVARHRMQSTWTRGWGQRARVLARLRARVARADRSARADRLGDDGRARRRTLDR